ncbi:Cell division control protein 2 [Geranomyces michiganensis]|nr:Cell division control protein 2 [Geranomyces michiganensis]
MLAGVTATPQPPMEWPLEIVRKYRIIERLGSGAYGAVFKAKTIKTIAAPVPHPEYVAIKRTKEKKPITSSDETYERYERGHLPPDLLREVGYLKALNHENVIRLIEAVFVRHANCNHGYLVLEYCPHTLHQRIRQSNGGLGLPLTAYYLRQILAGLKHCHDNRVFHRDLKPDNILIAEGEIIRIADFGLSRSISCPAKVLSPNTTTLTYRAPELLQNPPHESYRTYSHEIDMWSVGCVFGEMIRGDRMFPAASELQMQKDLISRLGRPNTEDFPNAEHWPTFYTEQKPGGSGLAKMVGFKQPLNSSCVKALALLQGLLTYNRIQRLRAAEALKHEFFASEAATMRAAESP